MKIKQFSKELEARLNDCLEWYRNCDVCDETLKNAKKDLNSVLKEVCKKYDFNNLFTLTALFENDIIVVKILDKKLN